MVLDVLYSVILLGFLGMIAYAVYQGIFGKGDYSSSGPPQNEQEFIHWREYEKWEDRRDL